MRRAATSLIDIRPTGITELPPNSKNMGSVVRISSGAPLPVVDAYTRNSFDDEKVVSEMPFLSGLVFDHLSNSLNIVKPGVFVRLGLECRSVNKIIR